MTYPSVELSSSLSITPKCFRFRCCVMTVVHSCQAISRLKKLANYTLSCFMQCEVVPRFTRFQLKHFPHFCHVPLVLFPFKISALLHSSVSAALM